MKKTIAYFMLTAAFLAVSAPASAADHDVPALGRSTGSNVRLRSDPGTEGTQVIGKVMEFDRFMVLGTADVKGEQWVQIDNPTADGYAWMSGRYVEIISDGSTPVQAAANWVKFTYGLTPQKARVLFGSPADEQKEKFHWESAGKDVDLVKMKWDTHSAAYLDGLLSSVEVRSSSIPFGSLSVGDSEETLRQTLGKPARSEDGNLIYEITPVETLTFTVRDGKIAEMAYTRYTDA